MKNPSFAKVVKTKRYKCHSHQGEDFKVNNTGEEFKPNHYIWENTNRMLWRGGYDGLKTGITPTAGPCLA
jgi:D-alanyl-D-alanine carboxypeptidase